MIIQKSFKFADLVLKKHFLLLPMLNTVVLFNIVYVCIYVSMYLFICLFVCLFILYYLMNGAFLAFI